MTGEERNPNSFVWMWTHARKHQFEWLFKLGVGQSKIIQGQNSCFSTPVHLGAANRRCCGGRHWFPSSPDGCTWAPRDAYGSAGSLGREPRRWLWLLVRRSVPPSSASSELVFNSTNEQYSLASFPRAGAPYDYCNRGGAGGVCVSVLNHSANVCGKLKPMHQFILVERWAITCFLGNMGLRICSFECAP